VPLHPWDEARLAVSAAEMAIRGDGIVVHYGGRPDLWNVKPPLMIWLQAGAMRLLGYSVLAVRLPALLAALATVAILYRFAALRLRSPAAGFAACAVLLTSGGYVQAHVARTGDYDALVILWQLAQLVAFFAYSETRRARDWWMFVAALILAAMTKGVVGLAPLAGIAAYAGLRGLAGPLLREPRVYGGAALFLAVVGGYYAAHEAATPGYIQAVWDNEIAGRMVRRLNGQGGSWAYYLRQMAEGDFFPWIAVLPPAAWLALKEESGDRRRAALLMLLSGGIWLAAISAAGTKLPWYEAPVYPPFALVVGLGMAAMWARLRQLPWAAPLPRRAGAAALALTLAWPALLQARRVADERRQGDSYRPYLAYLDSLASTPLRREPFTVLVPKLPELARIPRSTPRDPDERYTPVFDFYRIAYAQERGLRFDLATVDDIGAVPAGRATVLCGRELAEALAAQAGGDTLDLRGDCRTVRRRPERSPPSPL
jgi:4-amino-4-deoxy-L-arabinose transferase-like glycosyltransferase